MRSPAAALAHKAAYTTADTDRMMFLIIKRPAFCQARTWPPKCCCGPRPAALRQAPCWRACPLLLRPQKTGTYALSRMLRLAASAVVTAPSDRRIAAIRAPGANAGAAPIGAHRAREWRFPAPSMPMIRTPLNRYSKNARPLKTRANVLQLVERLVGMWCLGQPKLGSCPISTESIDAKPQHRAAAD